MLSDEGTDSLSIRALHPRRSSLSLEVNFNHIYITVEILARARDECSGLVASLLERYSMTVRSMTFTSKPNQLAPSVLGTKNQCASILP